MFDKSVSLTPSEERPNTQIALSSIEICAGAGGQALGLERAGFRHRLLVEVDEICCQTLMTNRPDWPVANTSLKEFDSKGLDRVDLLAGGLPCPPFSVAGAQLGDADERNLFGVALEQVSRLDCSAVLLENVRGLLNPKFALFREHLLAEFGRLGYRVDWRILNACDFGVAQLRPRLLIVALKEPVWRNFYWPAPPFKLAPTVGETLADLMSENGWELAKLWAEGANEVAPTIVGGSKRHGGPDLGPTRSRLAWRRLGINGSSLADEAPKRDFAGFPRLTVRMAARLQGFGDDWKFAGNKTAQYRQVGNAFPPPVAEALGMNIARAIVAARHLRGSDIGGDNPT